MDPGPPPTSTGRGTGSGRQGGRGASRGGRSGRHNFTPTISKHRFDGATEELKGQIFDLVGARSTDLFIKSKKALANYVGRTYQHSGDIRWAIHSPSQSSRHQRHLSEIQYHLSLLQSSANKSRNM